jgi:hypothetical protein
MPPDGGAGGAGADGPDISDLQPLTTSVATAISRSGLIQLLSENSTWLFFIVLPSRFEVWRRTLKPP